MTTKKVAVKKSAEKKSLPAALKNAQQTQKAIKASKVAGAPVTPLTKLLLGAGYTYVQSMPAELGYTAHGYNHSDGGAALFVHENTHTEIGARWTLKLADGTQVDGKTAKQLAEALHKPAVAASVLSALQLLNKLTKGSYSVVDLGGEANYKHRVQLLKKLKGTDKILVKESSTKHVLTALTAALDLKTTLSEANMKAHCERVVRQFAKTDRAVSKVEQEQAKEVLRRTAAQREVHDNKPILPGVKKLSAKKQQEADDKAKTELAAQIAQKRRQEEYTPIAVPRPESKVTVDLDSICLLEDPNNGIVLMCLEKPNSQGAICVYNNGSRVAAGVVPTEVLNSLRPLVSEDLIRDVNQLLHPITAGVIVTPQAEQQLTAVLNYCKENITMATENAVKTKKFAAPSKTAAKAVAAKAEKPVKAAKVAKAEKPASTRAKFAEDTKIKLLHKGENPYREGTKARESFELLAKAKTFGEYAAATAKSKKDVYEAGYFAKWASQPHGKAPAYVAVG